MSDQSLIKKHYQKCVNWNTDACPNLNTVQMQLSAINSQKTLLLCVFVLVTVTACAGPSRKNAVPVSQTAQATISGFSDIRYRIGLDTEAIVQEGIKLRQMEQAHLEANNQDGMLPPTTYLAISGGGDNGAFGAGLLCGWTKEGSRPQFKLVTGVSTGALIAPFAFLGPAYDDRLKELYTNISAADIMKRRNILSALTSDAIADNAPLWEMLEDEIDQEMLDAIAAEYPKGRALIIATVDLDTRQSVLWNMTKIADSQNPDALHLFRSIMVASAAIPGTFPPVMIDVEVDGKEYQEMHVDGGTMSQVFIYPPSLGLSKQIGTRSRTAYIIRNSRLDPEWASVDRRTLTIAMRAVSSLIHTQGIGDIYRIFLICQRDGVDFNLAFIPASFNEPHREQFDTVYMRALFELGYEMASREYPWKKTPPDYLE